MFTKYTSPADFHAVAQAATMGAPGHYDIIRIGDELAEMSVMGPNGYQGLPRLDQFWAVVSRHRLDTAFHRSCETVLTNLAAQHDGEGIMSTRYSRKGDYTLMSVDLLRADMHPLTVDCYHGLDELEDYLAITPNENHSQTQTYTGSHIVGGLVYIHDWFAGGDRA